MPKTIKQHLLQVQRINWRIFTFVSTFLTEQTEELGI